MAERNQHEQFFSFHQMNAEMSESSDKDLWSCASVICAKGESSLKKRLTNSLKVGSPFPRIKMTYKNKGHKQQ